MDQNFEKFDVVIIGASLSGNYLASLLSTKLAIAVIEEHKEIGLPFQCAGIVSQKLSQLIELPNKIILNRVDTAKIVAPSGKLVKLRGEEKPYIINRIALDRFFYEKAKEYDNVTYFLGEKFKSLEYIKEEKQKLVLINTSKRKIITKILIGSDGPLSLVAKSFGIKNELIYAIQIRIKSNFKQNEASMFFNPKWKELFGWIVPEGNSKIYRIGLASAENTKKNFEIFLKRLDLKLSEKIDQQGGIIPYGTMNKVAFDNVLLLGDSAGQVKATTGGGIVMLLISGQIAADCVRRCFKINMFSKKIIRKYYEKPCLNAIGRQLRLHYYIRKILEKCTNSDFEALFQIVRTNKIEKMISLYGDMDFPRSLVFRLSRNYLVIKFLLKFIKKNPSFIIESLKFLIKR